ncbi:WAT1-related protein At5g07050-like isoform X1 [Euphorbia lathyris]|uniref:WAT1-related protein At5g07050-like isoform X1 n=1 Tax=Euphorbia lathyris TaxID=212925 RepID=UPI0033136C05
MTMEIESSKVAYIWCVFSSLCYAGFAIITKLTLDRGMSRYVLVAYGHAFATLTTAILALFFDRSIKECRLTLPVSRNIVFLGILGALLRTLFYGGIECTSSTFAAAMTNLTPSITFLLAIFCRMEKLVIKKHSSQAKIAGTLVSFGGATIMTLYKGITLLSWHNQNTNQAHYSKSKVFSLDQGWIMGSLMLLIHCLSSAAFYILQAKTIEQYPAPIVLTSLSSLVGTVISTIATLILEHNKASVWRLYWNITLLAPLFSGIVIFGIVVYIQMLAIREKGPVFVTAFSPLATIMVAIMGLLILGEPLHLGSVVGAMLIIVGLYAILWGKEHENEKDATILDNSIHQIKLEK